MKDVEYIYDAVTNTEVVVNPRYSTLVAITQPCPLTAELWVYDQDDNEWINSSSTTAGAYPYNWIKAFNKANNSPTNPGISGHLTI